MYEKFSVKKKSRLMNTACRTPPQRKLFSTDRAPFYCEGHKAIEQLFKKNDLFVLPSQSRALIRSTSWLD